MNDSISNEINSSMTHLALECEKIIEFQNIHLRNLLKNRYQIYLFLMRGNKSVTYSKMSAALSEDGPGHLDRCW